MSDSQIREKIDTLLQSEVRTAKNLEEENKGFDAQYYSIEQTKQDVDEITMALRALDIMDMDEDTEARMEQRRQRDKLLAIKSRSQSHILVNMGQRKKDSREMSDVKTNILRLETLLQEKANVPLTVDVFNEIQMGYELTIAACRYYCSHKNPYYQSGKERLAMVSQVCSNLQNEAVILSLARNEFEKNRYAYGTIGEILQLDIKEKPAEKLEESEEQKEQKEQEQTPVALSKGAKKVESILSLNIKPSDLIKKAGSGAKSRSKVIQTYMNLHETLRSFEPGRVSCVNVKIDSKEIRLLQKADNSLYIIENGREFLMNLTAGLIADRIETDIIENGDVYGEQAVSDVITNLTVRDGDSDTGENLRIRELCLSLILNYVGINKTDLNNIPTYLVRDIAEEVALGGMSEDEVKTLVKAKDSRELINGQENLEIVRVVKRQKDGEFDNKVVLRKVEEEKEEEEGEKWTPEEEAVKNLIADLLYENETWSHDELLSKPGERLRRIIEKNIDVVAKVLVDGFRKEDPAESMLWKMLDRLSINIGGENGSIKEIFCQKIIELKKFAENYCDQQVKDQLIKTFGREKVLDSEGNYLPDDQLSFIIKGVRTTQNGIHYVALRQEPAMKNLIMSLLDDPESPLSERIKDMEKTIDDAVGRIIGSAQNVITEATKAIFDDEKPSVKLDKISAEEYAAQFPVKFKEFNVETTKAFSRDRNDLKKLKEEELEKRSKSAYDEGKDSFEFRKKPAKPKTLDDIIAESVKGKVGQGKFTKLVLQGYFQSVDVLDQRSMIASAVRNAKPISAKDKSQDTLMKEIAGNYLGGILKGAGPLLQKMMQGIPESGVPKEIRVAIKDMKSNLLPIPDELVKAQLLGMVERSKGKLTKMEVTKALGAASVGQAFLCKMYGPTLPAEGKQVVVKLLRPDVRNRLEREKAFMLKCASDTDESGGMSATYAGRLKKIMEELDLTIEAKNCRMGYVYNDKKASVQSMKINDIIEPTVNSLVLEQAEGTTVDKMLDETRAYIAELDEKYLGWNENSKTGRKKRSTSYEFKAENSLKFAEDRKKLVQMLHSLEKRQQHLADLAAMWVEQGIFGEGFYHGDLHAGNIMINDEHATVIDYGNAVKLTAEQQKHIIRMMCAAATGSMPTYRDSFRALLEQTKGEFYEAKRAELEKVFSETLSMGDESEVGQRIMASLIRAQELGLELPSSVFNFSQGELLLQNTISDINKLIRKTRDTMEKMDVASVATTPKIDAPSYVYNNISKDVEIPLEEKHSIFKATKTALGDIDKDELLSAVRKTKKTKADVKKGISAVDECAEFNLKYMNGITGIKSLMYSEVPTKDKQGRTIFKDGKPVYIKKTFDPARIREQFNNLVRNYSLKGVTDEKKQEEAAAKWKSFSDEFVVQALSEFKLEIFGGAEVVNVLTGRINEGDEEAFEQIMDIFVNQVNAADEVEQALKALRKEQQSWFPDKEKLKLLEEDFYTKYNRVHHIRGNNNTFLKSIVRSLSDDSSSTIEKVDLELKPWFEDQRDGLGAKLKSAYDEFRAYQNIVKMKRKALFEYDQKEKYHKSEENDIQTSIILLDGRKKELQNTIKKYEEAKEKLSAAKKQGSIPEKEKSILESEVSRLKKRVNDEKATIEKIEKIIPERQREWERRKDEKIGERPPEITEEERRAMIKPQKEFMEIYRKLAVLRLGDMADGFEIKTGERMHLKEIGEIVGGVVLSHVVDAGKMVGMMETGRIMKGMMG